MPTVQQVYYKGEYTISDDEVQQQCEKCGKELNVNPVDCPNVDWVKVVCSNCGTVNDISMIRFSQEVSSQ